MSWILAPQQTFYPLATPSLGWVGAVPGQAEAVATADAYTYGATSATLGAGQAMLAWADLAAKQNSPAVTAAKASGMGCSGGPGEWRLVETAPGEPTERVKKACVGCNTGPPEWKYLVCVNIDRVYLLPSFASYQYEKASDGYTLWFLNSEIVRYLRLNEPKAAFAPLSFYNDAVLRGLRAMKMTSPEYGWTNVRGQLLAAAWLFAGRGNFYDVDQDDVTDIRDKMVTAIGPSYDADVADPGGAAERRESIIRAALADAAVGRTPGAAALSLLPGLILIVGGGMLALSFLHPALATKIALGAGNVFRSGVSAAQSAFGRARTIVGGAVT